MRSIHQMKFGSDDDSIMLKLLKEMDIRSAAMHLRRIGFAYHKPPLDNGHHRFARRRKVDGEIEAVIIVMENGAFTVAHKDTTDTIHTWDQWVDFVRELYASNTFTCTPDK